MILRFVGTQTVLEQEIPRDKRRFWALGEVEYSEEFDEHFFKIAGSTDRYGVSFMVGTVEENGLYGMINIYEHGVYAWNRNQYDVYLMNKDGKTYQKLY